MPGCRYSMFCGRKTQKVKISEKYFHYICDIYVAEALRGPVRLIRIQYRANGDPNLCLSHWTDCSSSQALSSTNGRWPDVHRKDLSWRNIYGRIFAFLIAPDGSCNADIAMFRLYMQILSLRVRIAILDWIFNFNWCENDGGLRRNLQKMLQYTYAKPNRWNNWWNSIWRIATGTVQRKKWQKHVA